MSLHVSPVVFRFAYEVITWRGVSSRDPSTLGRGSNLPSSADQATCVHDVCLPCCRFHSKTSPHSMCIARAQRAAK